MDAKSPLRGSVLRAILHSTAIVPSSGLRQADHIPYMDSAREPFRIPARWQFCGQLTASLRYVNSRDFSGPANHVHCARPQPKPSNEKYSETTPGRLGARDDAPGCVAFRYLHGVGTQNKTLSRLDGWPMRPPVNASPKPSRATAHDSGPMWIATPSS